MGAFDGELYALGYRFATESVSEDVRPELVGPVYSGPCVRYCSSNRCVACSANNRLSDEEVEAEIAAHRESQAHLLRFGFVKRAAQENRSFWKTFKESI